MAGGGAFRIGLGGAGLGAGVGGFYPGGAAVVVGGLGDGEDGGEDY